MRYLSLFSGFEGATLAWKPLGWECAAVAEIDPAACSVLAHHYPDVPNLGDITKVTEQQIKDLGHIDIVIFGSPCQDVSIAGKRAGMKGARSGLFFTAMRVVRWSGARYALWENVPGVFSDNEGRGFAAVVGEMAGVHVDVPDGGWRNSGFFLGVEALVEWAVLDAQFFGVPQRRRRVFALRDSGDWQSRPPILLERESLCGNSPPRREAGERVASSFTPSFHGGYADGIGTLRSNRGDLGGGSESLIATDVDCDGGVIASTGEVSHCLNAGGMGRQDFETETLITFMASDYSSGSYEEASISGPLTTGTDQSRSAPIVTREGFDASEDGTGRGTPIVAVGAAKEGEENGSETKAYASEILRNLRQQVGEEAFEEWGIGVASALQSTAILQSGVHEDRLQSKAEDWNILGGDSQTRSKNGTPWPVFRLWEAFCVGCPPQKWRPSVQLSRQLAAYMSKLPYQTSSFAPLVLGLRESSEGLGLLREALSAVQEVWRPIAVKAQSEYATGQTGRVGGSGVMAVRRLTPRLCECARLQGVPDSYLNVQHRGRPLADGPKYNLLGNGFAIPVIAWIGKRIKAAMEKGCNEH